MYFGIRYAVNHVEADADLAGLLITGTGDVFAPGGDLGGGGRRRLDDLRRRARRWTPLPFDTLRQSAKPVVAAVNGLCQGGGLQIAMCSDMAVVSDRATFRVPELYRGIADTYYSHMLARLIGPVRTRDLMFTGRTLTAAGGRRLGHGRPAGAARRADGRGPRGARPVLPHRAGRADRGQVEPGQLHRPVRPDRHEGQPAADPKRSRASWRSRSAAHPTGCTRTCGSTGASSWGQAVGLSTSWAMDMLTPASMSMAVWFSTTRLRLGDMAIDRT